MKASTSSPGVATEDASPRGTGSPAPVVGRYTVYSEIAAGGMASVHLGRLSGAGGFARTVAIKRMHPHLARDPEFVSMFMDEARLAARIHHPNVVSTLDVVATQGDLLVVMEYVHGDSLSALVRASSLRAERVPVSVAIRIVLDALYGLHAAHEAANEHGEPLRLVHRDVSPQNVLVGVDGVARVIDFGVAKATHRLQTTREGQLKGKIAYMSPEQVIGGEVDRRADVFATSAVLWEVLTGRRLFPGENDAQILHRIANGRIPKASTIVPKIAPTLDAIVERGLAYAPADRFATARDMATAIEGLGSSATPAAVSDWVKWIVKDRLEARALKVAEIESASSAPIRAPVGETA
jgi:serine/threonine protein kinase